MNRADLIWIGPKRGRALGRLEHRQTAAGAGSTKQYAATGNQGVGKPLRRLGRSLRDS